MIAYREEKINNAICYFAFEHFKRTRRLIRQTLLYKYLGFLDFISIKETGKPVTELRFSAYPKGPVPTEISSKRDDFNTECFSFINTGGNYYKIIAKKEPDLDYFSKFETEIMKRIVEKYSKKELSNEDMINLATDDSHNIPSWNKARKRDYKKMLYEDMFPDIHKKSEDELTPEEENFLVYQGLKEITNDNRRRFQME